MVNAQLISEEYRCSKCGKVYSYKKDAEECCKKQKINYDSITEFELKQEHLDLLKEVFIDWQDCEFGAPAIDCKRPYGNSDVFDDIAEIINLKKKNNYDYEEETWNEEAMNYMEDLHKQTRIALQIILKNKTFKLGLYKRNNSYENNWVFVKK